MTALFRIDYIVQAKNDVDDELKEEFLCSTP
jgi:hypothetical protein